MEHTIHIGDLVRANTEPNTDPNLSKYEIGVVLDIQGENLTLALPHLVIHGENRSIIYYDRSIRDIFIKPLTKKMVTDGVITEDQYNEAIQFKQIMEEKKIDSSGERVLGRVKGGRKKTNKKRKSKSSRSKKRRHRK